MSALRCAALLAMAPIVVACSLLPAKQAQPALYDFGPLPQRQTMTGDVSSLHVSGAPWLDTPAIVYRLEYRDAAQVAFYRDSQWVAPPATMFAERLRQRIAPATAVTTPARLRIDIEEFCQSFVSAGRSRAVVRVRATRLDGETGQVVAVKTVLAEAEAETADAPGAAHALSRAADSSIEQIAAWLSPTQTGIPP